MCSNNRRNQREDLTNEKVMKMQMDEDLPIVVSFLFDHARHPINDTITVVHVLIKYMLLHRTF